MWQFFATYQTTIRYEAKLPHRQGDPGSPSDTNVEEQGCKQNPKGSPQSLTRESALSGLPCCNNRGLWVSIVMRRSQHVHHSTCPQRGDHHAECNVRGVPSTRTRRMPSASGGHTRWHRENPSPNHGGSKGCNL